MNTTAAAARQQEAVAATLAGLGAPAPSQPSASADPAGLDFSPLPAGRMRGDAVTVTVGSHEGGLTLVLRPLSRRRMREEFVPLMAAWPEVLQFAAAVQRPSCPGIDYDGTANLLTAFNLQRWAEAEREREAACVEAKQPFVRGEPPAPITAEDVADMVSELVEGDALADYDDIVCRCVWMLAEGTPGLVWPPPQPAPSEAGDAAELADPAALLPPGHRLLSEALEEHLSVPDYVDLRRALLRANGGFKGDVEQRFTRP